MNDPWLNMIGRLRNAGIDADDRQLAEIAWLGLRLPARESARDADSPPAAAQTDAPPPVDGPPPDLQPQAAAPAPQTQPPSQSEDASLYADAGAGAGTAPASRVRVPGVAALPAAAEVNRSLRPLLRRAASRRFRILDEDATVTASADAGCTLPVFRGLPERRFDAAIVVEQKPTMTVWRETVREFQRLLERHGSFGDVRRWGLEWRGLQSARPGGDARTGGDARPGGDARTEVRATLISASGAEHPPAALNDPMGRRVIFLFTDGVSAAWANGAMAELVVEWGARMPVVLVQMLGSEMWRLTPLGKPTATVASRQPGAANASLTVFPPSYEEEVEARIRRKQCVALPVVTLTPARLAPWAAMLMAGRARADAFLLSPANRQPSARAALPADDDALSPEARFERFKELVSPTAFRLAGYLSLVPLHLPVMRMVQQLMLPDSHIEHLSEVLLGGIVRRAEIPGLPLETGEVAFEFVDERLIDLLMEEEVRKYEMNRIHGALSKYIEGKYGIVCDFKALLADKDGKLQVNEKALPFARLADRARRKFGLAPRPKPPVEPPPDPADAEREIDALFARLHGEDSLEAQRELLQRAGDPRVIERLGQAITDAALDGLTIQLLIQIGGEQALAELRKQLLRTDHTLHDSIMGALASTLHDRPEAMALLAGLLLDTPREAGDDLALAAIESLEHTKHPEAASALTRFIERAGESVALRIAAAEALGRMRIEGARLSPQLMLDSIASPELCLAMIRAEAEIGGGLDALRDLRRTLFYDHNETQYQRLLPFIDQVIRDMEFGDLGLLVHEFTVVKLNEAGEKVQEYQRSAGYFEDSLGADVSIKMAAIPGGEFLMGSLKDEERSYDDERPQHRVTVSPFFMGVYPVTQAQWAAVARMKQIDRELKEEPSHFKGDNRPVEQVSWDDAQEFCKRLSNATGKAYRLPSEAEWEYACRAGTTTPFHFGPTVTPDWVNYNGEYPYGQAPKGVYRKETTPVGSFKAANDFGLFDMHGNVWEWCEDEWHENYDSPDRPDDGSAWISSKQKKEDGVIAKVAKRIRGKVDSDDVKISHGLRGGSWGSGSGSCRSSCRNNYRFDVINYLIGFRVVVSSRTA